jgi:hypothetical protein
MAALGILDTDPSGFRYLVNPRASVLIKREDGAPLRIIPTARGRLTYRLLEEGYQMATYSAWEPGVLRGSPTTLRGVQQFLRQYLGEVRQFNAAILHTDVLVPDGILIFDQAKYPALVILDEELT